MIMLTTIPCTIHNATDLYGDLSSANRVIFALSCSREISVACANRRSKAEMLQRRP